MPRIPDSAIERLKREVDLLELVRASGVKLKRHGADWIGLCPFHQDREPSLVVTPAKNLWHCLGACRQGGSAIDWVIKREGVGFREAVAQLNGGSIPVGSRSPSQPSSQPSRPPAAKQPATPTLKPGNCAEAELLDEVVAHYHQRLLGSEAALDYLESRGLRERQAIARFRLGVADRTLGPELSEQGEEGRAKRERLQKLGVFRPSGHEHFNGCLVVPIPGGGGEIVNLYGRRLAPPGKGAPAHLYLPGPHRGVWNRDGLAGAREVILCESLLDALSFWVAGFKPVTSSYGVNGFTDEHLEAFQSGDLKRVLIAYDADRAGNEAAVALAERLAQAGLSAARVRFPKGMDANAYAVKVTPASESLGLAVKSAEPMTEPAAGSGKRRAAKGEPATSPLAAPAAAPTSPDPSVRKPVEPQSFDLWEKTIGDRTWRVRGLGRNLSFERLQVLLRVAGAKHFYLDTVDLTQAKQRAGFVRQAAAELELKEEVIKRDLGRVHLDLEELQERLIAAELAPQETAPEPMAPEAERSALDYLKQPDLLKRILADFQACGVVGEETNKLTGYLAVVSRKLERPLALLIQSSSAAGKSSLMEAILDFMPTEERVQYSAVTGQSLFYMGEADLQHKILALVEEEGAERAAYALKLLQSEGELSIASTGKDPKTGKLVTHEYRVQGPVMLCLTTTSIAIDEELLNRCLVLTVDESRRQTRAIHRMQRRRRTLAGLAARRRRRAIVALHRNLQRLIKPLPVVNPYAQSLTFFDGQTRSRRDHEKYLTLIEAVTLLHQYQRQRKRMPIEAPGAETVEYLEVTAEDIATANRLAAEVLGRSLDELPPQSRRFLTLLDRWVTSECERLAVEREELLFRRRQVVEALGWSLTQVKVHLDRLVEHEIVLVHRGGRGQSFVYELVWEDPGLENLGPGRETYTGLLIDPEATQNSDYGDGDDGGGDYDANLTGFGAHLTGSKRAQNGGVSGRSRGRGKAAKERQENDLEERNGEISENALLKDTEAGVVPTPASFLAASKAHD